MQGMKDYVNSNISNYNQSIVCSKRGSDNGGRSVFVTDVCGLDSVESTSMPRLNSNFNNNLNNNLDDHLPPTGIDYLPKKHHTYKFCFYFCFFFCMYLAILSWNFVSCNLESPICF